MHVLCVALALGTGSGCSLLFESTPGQSQSNDAGSSCSDTADFENIAGEDPEILGVHGGIDFGQRWNRWLPGGAINPYSSSVAASIGDSNSNSFSFETEPRRLTSATVYNFDHEVTVTFKTNMDSVSVTVDQTDPVARIDLNFSAARIIEIESTAGFNFFIDDICHEP